MSHPYRLGKSAVTRPKVFFALVLALMLVFVPMISNATGFGTLSSYPSNGGITAVLSGSDLTDTPITVHVTDENGQLFVQTLTRTSDSIWQTVLPIRPQSATLHAYQDGTSIASMSRTYDWSEFAQSSENKDEGRLASLARELVATVLESVGIAEESKESVELVSQAAAVEYARSARTHRALPNSATLPNMRIENEYKQQVAAHVTFADEDKLTLIPQITPIEEISFNELDTSTIETLRISEPALETIPVLDEHKQTLQTYAIDPEDLSFTNATLKITAKGSELYKCALWNFTTQTCNGDWVLHKRITPGQEYEVLITPNDPAYGETTLLAMEWNRVLNVNDTWQVVQLNYSYVSPVVIATPHYIVDGVPTVTRIANASGSNFSIRLQAANNSAVTTRNVSYLVVEAGNWTLSDGTRLEAATYTSTTTDRSGDWSPDSRSYLNSYTTPIVLGQVMSFNDDEWSVFWTSDGSQVNPPTASSFATGKHVAGDPSTTRSDETIGYVVIEQGHRNFSGIEYDAHMSGDTIRGIGNTPPYTSSFIQAFSSAPEVVLATMSAMDGGDGGWAFTYGTSTASLASLAVDEDTIGDTERAHTPEEVFVLAFETAGSFLDNEAPVISGEVFDASIIEPLETATLNVTVTDANGNASISYVNATLLYPNGTLINTSLTQFAIGDSSQSSFSGESIVGEFAQVIGETHIFRDVSSWQTISFNNTYENPYVFAFTLNQSDRGTVEEEALATITNVTPTSFALSVIAPNSSFITDDVGVLILENGTWNISGSNVQTGNWTYSGTSFVTRNFREAFSSDPTAFIQIQDQTTAWYTGRYDDGTLSGSSINIQYEDALNAFPDTVEVAYVAFEQGTTTSAFEGDIEASVDEDPNAGDWRALSFTNSYEPLFFGIVSDGGGDPTKLGIGSLTSSTVNIRTTEETFSDPEQGHATNDVLWMVFNNSGDLFDEESSVTDTQATKFSMTYEDVDNVSMQQLSTITININITEYNNSGSVANQNADPTIQAQVMTSSGWTDLQTKIITGPGIISWTTISSSVLSSWTDVSNRDVRFKLINMDYNSSNAYDNVSWNNASVQISGGDPTSIWRLGVSETGDVGIYNITSVSAFDYIDLVVSNYTGLSFEVRDQTPPMFTYLANQTFNINFLIGVTFKAEDYSGILSWGLNETDNFSINNSGYLTNVSELVEMVYALNVSVNDTYNNTNHGVVHINITTVADTINPEFDPVLTNVTVELGAPLSYDINATDNSGRLDVFSVNDTVNFAIDAETGVLTNATELAFTDYVVEVSINDTSGNVNTSNLTVHLVDMTEPTIIIVNQTAEFGYDFAYQVNATDAGGVGTYALSGTAAFTINSSGVIENATSLIKDQNYLMTVIVNDTSNNSASALLLVTVTDTLAPASITGLTNSSRGKDWIRWTWTNPAEDFSHVQVYVDSAFYSNTSLNAINITGFSPGTSHEIGIHTVDSDDNINTSWVNNTAQTLSDSAPQISLLSPANGTVVATLPFEVSYNVTDDDLTCTQLYGSNTTPVITDNTLLASNCSTISGSTLTADWYAPVFDDIATTEVLWHFDRLDQHGETDTLVKNFATGASENHNRTCVTDCPTFREGQGVFGGAYEYDGSTQHWFLDESFFNNAFTEKTIEVWIYPHTTSGSRFIFEEGGGTNGIAVRINDGLLEFATRDSSNQFTISTPFTYTNSWHLVSAEFDDGVLNLYINGTLMNTTTASYSSVAAHSNDGALGASFSSNVFGGSTTDAFDGLIDEVRILTSAGTLESSGSLSDGVYYVSARASDAYSTVSSEVRTLILDTTAPSWSTNVSLPAMPTAYNASQNYTFNVSWSEANTISHVILEHNLSGVFENITLSSDDNITYGYTFSDVGVGRYAWRMHANDSLDHRNQTPFFTYEIGKAFAGLELLLNGSLNNISVEDDHPFNVTGLMNASLFGAENNLTIYVDGSRYASGAANLTSELRLTNVGVHIITLSLPYATNYTSPNITRNVTVFAETVIDVIGNASNVSGNAQNASIFVNGSLLNDSLDYDGLLNVTLDENGTNISRFVHDFATPLNLSTISLYSYADGGVGIDDPNHNSVTLFVPINGSLCNVQVCDGVSASSGCNVTNEYYAYPTPVNGFCLVVVNGTYAKDDPDGTDFEVSELDIGFSPETLIENSNITINVSVSNLGATWADNVTVLIIDNSTGGILENHTIANFTAGTTFYVHTSIIGEVGSKRIDVRIDPENEFVENNELNNNASRWLNISSWHTLYGFVNQTVAVGIDGYNMYVWPTLENVSGNLFAASTDALIDWGGLYALGRTNVGGGSSNDFTEADEVLNLTNASDNVNATFSSDGSNALRSESFTIFDRVVEQVPYINSTNNSNFITGILWDASDSGDAQFDATDNEDLVFITRINESKQGMYGRYDYEIRVPSRLRDQHSDKSSVYLYMELGNR